MGMGEQQEEFRGPGGRTSTVAKVRNIDIGMHREELELL